MRCDSAGIVKPCNVTALAKSSALTSGDTLRSIAPDGVIVGVNVNCTPNGLNCTVITGDVAPPVDVVVRIGNGNEPPARKLASLPSSVTRFGSARICSRFWFCRALIVAPMFRSGR